MNTLVLSVNPRSWQLYMRRRDDRNFRSIRDKIFDRDRHTCQFCGFQAQEYQEVVNLDQNYRNNISSNMVTSCCFCAQCSFVEAVGESGFGGGRLIYLPEVSQVELNSFCHVIFCAMTNGTAYRDTAQTIYRNLKFRSNIVEDKFGEGTSRPNIFGKMIFEYGDEKDNLAKKILKDLRLLPSYPKFKVQLERWAVLAAEELEATQ